MRNRSLVAAVGFAAALGASPAGLPAQTPAAPRIEFTQPSEGARIADDRTAVSATITDEVGVTKVVLRVNGERVSEMASPTEPQPRVTLSTTVPLAVGENVIGITATNRTGRIAQAIRIVARPAPPVAAPPPAPPSRPKSDGYAVVVGVGEYEDKRIPPVKFAENDARAVYAFLTTKAGYKPDNVVLLSDAAPHKPTLANIKRALGDVIRRAKKDDTVVIYYAGQGATEMDVASREADGLAKYLVPRDTEAQSLFTTALPMDDIVGVAQRVLAERVIVALDTSFSGRAGSRSFSQQSTRSAVTTQEFLERIARSRGRVIITASGPNQVALELADVKHGLFTYLLLQGAGGAADSDRDGVVTVNELYSYVLTHVPERARQQNERQSPTMVGDLGDLPFVLVPK